jgi:uncharacterized protein (DUF1330 family)
MTMLEPTIEQRARLRGTPGSVALAHFYTLKDPSAFDTFYKMWSAAVAHGQGKHAYRSTVDFSLIGPQTSFTEYLIDVFPSAATAQDAFDAVSTQRPAALNKLLVLTLRPESAMKWRLVEEASKAVHRVFGKNLTTLSEFPVPERPLHPDFELTPSQYQQMLSLPQQVPVTMLNLNRFRLHAQYPSSFRGQVAVRGQTACSRYGRGVLPHLLKRGAYPVWSGRILSLFVGADDHLLAEHWDDFIVNTYPSRLALRDTIADPNYRKTLVHRDAGLERALVLQGEPLLT